MTSDVRRRIRAALGALVTETFTICLLAAVLSVVVLAYVFGADGQLVVVLLAFGVIAAFAETMMRRSGDVDG